jgi:ubiquinone/menaquinone biosynthesis C-methylase UbiE
MAEQTASRAAELGNRVARFARLAGTERVLDAGTGTGTLALGIAAHVREVVGVDLVPELLSEARRLATDRANISFVEADVLALPFGPETFDLAASARTLHHVARPELLIPELARVTRPGGGVLLIDQLASPDPLEGVAHDRIERLRDPSHTRTLSDQDLRGLLEMNSLVLRRFETCREERDLARFLDLGACHGAPREAVCAEVERLVEQGESAGIDLRRTAAGYAMTVTVGSYLAVKPTG